MQKINNNNKKVESKANENVTEVNLQNLVKNVTVKEVNKSANKGATVYKYSDEQKKLGLSHKDNKKFRRQMRNNLEYFANSIVGHIKANNVDAAKKTFAEFNEEYKKYYLINDYSIGSITQSVNDDNLSIFKVFLEICKVLQSKK